MPNTTQQLRTLSATVADVDAIRQDTYGGRAYTVVPVVALVEGVLQGMNAAEPELALASEFGRFPAGWNGRPLVLTHPVVEDEDGNTIPVSANAPAVLEQYYMGMIFNTYLDDGKLKMEAWFDNELIANKGGDFESTLERICSGDEMIEVSTGLYTNVVSAKGTYNGQKYAGKWSGCVPDHLAILPNSIGACSVEGGCGIPRLNTVRTAKSCGDTCKCGGTCMSQNHSHEGEEATPEVNTSGDVPQPQTTAEDADVNVEQVAQEMEALTAHVSHVNGLVANSIPGDMVIGDAQTLVNQALREALNREYVYVIAMTSEMVVYYDYSTTDGLYVQRSYTIGADGGVTFTGQPEPVILITKIMPRPETVMANQGGAEAGTSPNSQNEGPMAGETVQNRGEGAAAPEAGSPNVNSAGAQTVQAYIEAAPAEIRELLTNSLRLHTDRKNGLIQGILANARNKFTKEQLEVKSFEEIQMLHDLAAPETPSFAGRGAFQPEAAEGLNANQSDAPEAPLRAFEAGSTQNARPGMLASRSRPTVN